MNREPIITVEALSKRYVLGSNGSDGARYRTLREEVASALTAPFRRRPRNGAAASPAKMAGGGQEFWALRDVSFEVARGEVVGVIGRNGAGKSTLLKILSRITEPTKGKISLKGRVASLLEVGTGFHPELTGRENIFLNGAILGMHRTEIKAKFDEIVAFAEVEKFLDTPVKRYSSGMYVRLAFAVAAHMEPEILVVDEVLAVGDAEFQKKCLGKMDEVAKREGRTVLFVSHSMAAISDLTTRCILLGGGKTLFDGASREAVSRYLGMGRQHGQSSYHAQTIGNRPQIVRVELKTSDINSVQAHGDPLEIVVDLFTPQPVRSPCLTLQIVDEHQQPVVQLWTFQSQLAMLREAGTFTLRCVIPALRLFIGNYTLTAHFAEGTGGDHFGSLEGLCPFEVIMRAERPEYPWVAGDCQYLEEFSWRLETSPRLD